MSRIEARNHKYFFAAIAFMVMTLLLPLGTEAQVVLELIDPVSGTNTVTLTPGQSGSFEFVVTGLTVSQPLDSFSLAVGWESYGSPGDNINVSGYTSLLPTGWNHGTLQYVAPFTG